VGGVGGSFAFGYDDAGVGVVVGGFLVGFAEPLGGVEAPSVVFAFDDDSGAVTVADVGDVTFVSRPGFDPSVYAVIEVVAEEVSDLSFKFGSGLFGAVSVSCHL